MFRVPGIALQDVPLTVPLDHEAPGSEQIEVFARVLTGEGGEDRPYLLYLTGGPGFEAPRPAPLEQNPGWLRRALQDFRVVLLDGRGTGRSSPVGLHSLPPGAGAQAAHLRHFRADSIVRDAEALREHLGAETWWVLGQSFGGFCLLSYLSRFPEAVAGALFTGGLPALDRSGRGRSIDGVYALTWNTLRERSRAHYRRFPEDRARLARLMDRAGAGDLLTLGGDAVTPEMLRRLGMHLGAAGGGERLHFFLEQDPDSPAFRAGLRDMLPFSARNPLYFLLHEACWADGGVTDWAAERTMPADFHADPTLLAGEHPHRDFLLDPLLAPYAGAAERLAREPWGPLYDPAVLRGLNTPAAAAIYVDDAFVPFDTSRETARLLPGLRPYITNRFEHDGLRAGGEAVLGRLLGLARGLV